MVGPEGFSQRRRSLSFVTDAWLGREGRSLEAAQLRSFYARPYLDQHPDMDAADAPYKATLLSNICALGGLTRTGSILEIGCGSGALLAAMKAQLSASIAVGVDYSHAIAALGRQRHGHRPARADGAALPFHSRAFDLVYFADVLEHVLDPVAFLREAARVGKQVAFLIPIEGGLINTPIYVSRRIRGKSTNYEQYGHIWRWSRRQILGLLNQAGLRLDQWRCHQAPIKVSGLNGMGRLFEHMREGAGRISPDLAEALFGTAALVGLARVD
jgi:SAM-dependent methyltransferase